MPVLYVANSTKQQHNFNYRLPEKDKLFMQKIETGSQIAIKLEKHEITWVLDQHSKYGLVNVKEVKPKQSYSGLCYSIDSPIPEKLILNAFSVKDDAITDRSLEHRKNTAAMIEKSISEQAREMGIEAGSTQIEIEEEKTGPADNESKFKETIEVSNPSKRGRKRKQF